MFWYVKLLNPWIAKPIHNKNRSKTIFIPDNSQAKPFEIPVKEEGRVSPLLQLKKIIPEKGGRKGSADWDSITADSFNEDK